MKKILIIALLAASPAFAACNLTGGACSPSDLYQPALQERYLPNSLQQLQKPNAFQGEYQPRYNEQNLNMSPIDASEEGSVPTENYNSSCQFGFCPER
ncbi:MAG: hypothetical protein LBK53_01920 [Heliobacteriaceae bacterium]|nr:hypothetical protein [Heliobacteriaceae bacterium]